MQRYDNENTKTTKNENILGMVRVDLRILLEKTKFNSKYSKPSYYIKKKNTIPKNKKSTH